MGASFIIIQEVPDGRKESPGGPWQFIGIMPLFDPPRHDSAETIRRALNLGVNVKMITGWLLSDSLFVVVELWYFHVHKLSMLGEGSTRSLKR